MGSRYYDHLKSKDDHRISQGRRLDKNNLDRKLRTRNAVANIQLGGPVWMPWITSYRQMAHSRFDDVEKHDQGSAIADPEQTKTYRFLFVQ
jgi:hypothetical protein